MVVEGNGKKLAIECEGDRYISTERLQEKLDRQAVLERLGWVFVRVRGSEFFSDQTKAMSSIFQRLADLQIPPEGAGAVELGSDQGLSDRLIERAAELRQSWGYPNVEVRAISIRDEEDSQYRAVDPTMSKISIDAQLPVSMQQRRAVSDLPEDEIRSAILACVPSAGEIEHNHLLHSAALRLGYREMSLELRNCLNQVIDAERLAGRLETITGVQKHRRASGPA
jgi:hypothetical protein